MCLTLENTRKVFPTSSIETATRREAHFVGFTRVNNIRQGVRFTELVFEDSAALSRHDQVVADYDGIEYVAFRFG